LFDISVGGTLREDETSAQTIKREAYEELNLEIDATQLVFAGSHIDTFESGDVQSLTFADVYFLPLPDAASQLRPNPKEVQFLLSMDLWAGKLLFSDKQPQVTAVRLGNSNRKEVIWTSGDNFVFRCDRFYYKIFYWAEKLLGGEEYVAI
jgi:8-oxo-dGTP pyrophosphatase MutT (NUDIX family)